MVDLSDPENEAWLCHCGSMTRLYEKASKVAGSRATVFLSGESGTGKEILARHIHAASPRRQSLFVAVNCAAFPETLADSQLFGHVRGAFTGAVSDQRGYLEVAHGGTLFLDEIAELRPEVQAKLLRAIEDRRIRRLGSEQETGVNVRILAAARQAPEELVKQGKLRDDLFFRLGAIHLHLPSLRERAEDISGLALHFLFRFSREAGKPVSGLTSEALEVLERYPWPGNIRELRNAMERAVVFAEPGTRIGLEQLPEALLRPKRRSQFAVEAPRPLSLRKVSDLYIQHVLECCDGNRAEAARLLEVSPSTLWRHRPEKRRGPPAAPDLPLFRTPE